MPDFTNLRDTRGALPDLLLFPEPEARRKLGGISKRKMSQLVRDGEIAVVRIGRRIFFTPESLRRFVDERTEGAS